MVNPRRYGLAVRMIVSKGAKWYSSRPLAKQAARARMPSSAHSSVTCSAA